MSKWLCGLSGERGTAVGDSETRTLDQFDDPDTLAVLNPSSTEEGLFQSNLFLSKSSPDDAGSLLTHEQAALSY